MYSAILAFSLLSAVAAVPTPDSVPFKNWLVPNENGELVYANADQIKARMAARDFVSISKRDDCDAEDSKYADRSCNQFCERAVSDIIGGPVKVSADINCNVATCAIAKAESTTITESISISVGGTTAPGNKGAATLTSSVSYSWSKAETTSDTYTFTPSKGDKGYLVFRPALKKSCGKFLQWSEYTASGPFPSHGCEGKPQIDENACGEMPKKLSTGRADGEFAFCNTNTNDGC